MARPQDSPRPLNVSIVGAGIGGLAAAAALRRRGHIVTIFEVSQIQTAIGAGLGMQLNSLPVLKQLGYVRQNVKPNNFEGMVALDAQSGDATEVPWPKDESSSSSDPEELHGFMCHRGDLHEELKRLAVGEGEGPPAQIHLGNKVIACDADAATVTLASGEIIHADLVVGADGIHSVVRTSILGEVVKSFASGWSCFRCLFDAAKLKEIPELKWLTEGLKGPRSIVLRDTQLLMLLIYPVRSGALINFVGFHEDPNKEDLASTPSVTKEDVLAKFRGFHPKFLRVLDLPLATPTILRWQLRALPILPTWIRGRALILGDAAHGTLPLLGQGATMDLEDAATLGCLLPAGTTPDEVPKRLEAWQVLRKERGDFVNTESLAQASADKRGLYVRSQEMRDSVLKHDTVKVAEEYLDAHFGRRAESDGTSV